MASRAVDATQIRPVTHARGNRDDRAARQPSNHAGQRSLHTGDRDDYLRAGDILTVREEPIQSQQRPHRAPRVRGFPKTAQSARPPLQLGMSLVPAVMMEDLPVPVGFGQLAHHTGTSALVQTKSRIQDPAAALPFAHPGATNPPSTASIAGNDAGNLFGVLLVYHFGHTGANTSLVVNAGVFEVGHRIHANLMYQSLGDIRPSATAWQALPVRVSPSVPPTRPPMAKRKITYGVLTFHCPQQDNSHRHF